MHSARESKGCADDRSHSGLLLESKPEHADYATGAQVILLRDKILLEFFRPSILMAGVNRRGARSELGASPSGDFGGLVFLPDRADGRRVTVFGMFPAKKIWRTISV